MSMMIGAAAPSNSVANMAGSLAIMLFLLFGGFLLNKDQVPWYCAWLASASFFKYAYEALAVSPICNTPLRLHTPEDLKSTRRLWRYKRPEQPASEKEISLKRPGIQTSRGEGLPELGESTRVCLCPPHSHIGCYRTVTKLATMLDCSCMVLRARLMRLPSEASYPMFMPRHTLYFKP